MAIGAGIIIVVAGFATLLFGAPSLYFLAGIVAARSSRSNLHPRLRSLRVVALPIQDSARGRGSVSWHFATRLQTLCLSTIFPGSFYLRG